jgi:hypothetical protein
MRSQKAEDSLQTEQKGGKKKIKRSRDSITAF